MAVGVFVVDLAFSDPVQERPVDGLDDLARRVCLRSGTALETDALDHRLARLDRAAVQVVPDFCGVKTDGQIGGRKGSQMFAAVGTHARRHINRDSFHTPQHPERVKACEKLRKVSFNAAHEASSEHRINQDVRRLQILQGVYSKKRADLSQG